MFERATRSCVSLELSLSLSLASHRGPRYFRTHTFQTFGSLKGRSFSTQTPSDDPFCVRPARAPRRRPQRARIIRVQLGANVGRLLFSSSRKQALCELINTLRPGTIKKVKDSTFAFKQLENISKWPPPSLSLSLSPTGSIRVSRFRQNSSSQDLVSSVSDICQRSFSCSGKSRGRRVRVASKLSRSSQARLSRLVSNHLLKLNTLHS